MSMPEFTAHNIELGDGTWTLPDLPPTAGNEVARATFRLLKKYGVSPPARIADLGALEGGYAVAFARAGYQATAVEVRPRNMARCQYVAERVDLPNLEFIQDDARNLATYGTFDAVFCCGLLYHLDRPGEFLRMLGTVTKRLLILQTHFSVHPDTVSEEGLPGHWYPENPLAISAWSSWENNRSFWLSEPALLKAVRAAGFSDVARQPDGFDPAYGDGDRAMFTGVKPL